MREIKFRVWEKVEKETVSWEDILTNLWLYMSGKYAEKFPLMQYTGLKDKNGVEIYEGDIVKRTDGSLREVKWAKFGFELYSLTIPNRYWNSDYLDWEQSEVIGNIYEGKEEI